MTASACCIALVAAPDKRTARRYLQWIATSVA